MQVLRIVWPYAAPALMLVWFLAVVARKTPGLKGVTKSSDGRLGLAATVATLAILLTWLPVFPDGQAQFSLGSYVLSANPMFSVCALAILASFAHAEVLGVPLLLPRDMVLLCLWLVVLAIILYASTLGFVSYDLYAQGYGFSWWFLVIGTVTLILSVLGQTRLATVGIVAIAAYDLRLLPSANLFDYLIDGPSAFFAFFYLIYQTVRTFRERSRTISQ